MSDTPIIERLFGLRAAGTTVSRELAAGLTTFLTMAYILAVNPRILGAAIPIADGSGFAQLLTTTALAACIGCVAMGLFARYPFALAPGMGLNAYFAYTVVLTDKVPWQTALGAVFISGLLFLLLSVVGVRTAIVRAIPRDLRIATAAGIGLFLAFIGLQSAGIVVRHDQTLVTLGDVTAAGPLLSLLGLLLITVLLALKVRAAILLGIVAVTAAAIVSDAPVYEGQAFAGFTEGVIRAPVWPKDLVGALDIAGALELGLVGIVFVFVFVDLFDTAGTLIGLGQRAGVIGEDGELPRATQAFTADAVATTAGALLGTSTTTSYIESASGMESGGKTGLTAVFVGLFFVSSIFLWPLFAAIPGVATAPALIVVGALMLDGVGTIRWGDYHVAVPAFITLIAMPLTFSIANGIALGLIAWTIVHLATGRHREVHWILGVLTVLLIARYIWLAHG